MAEQDGARVHLPDEVEELLAIRVSREVEVLHFAALGDFAAAAAEDERLALLRRFETSPGVSGSA